ncbi:MAG: rhodanese-related sulfurtransferase [Minisyncoccia bacterium]
MNLTHSFAILLFYKYVEIEDPEKLRDEQRRLCEKLGLKGRVIVAKEGINATLEGTKENIEKYLEAYLSDTRFSDTHTKRSRGTGEAFPRLSVKVRPEIVSLHLEKDINPNEVTGKHVKPEELKQWFQSGKDFVILDMRNDYEFKVGRFKNSIMPNLQNFRDVPKVLSQLKDLRDKEVLTVCTGGVRCEKASGFLVREGFKNVYQLDGGIVSYMEKYPAEEFEGSLYVFDKRILMHFDQEDKHVVVGTCEKCGEKSERYVNCKYPMCNKHFICCEDCSEEDGKSFCGEVCKNIVLTRPNPED